MRASVITIVEGRRQQPPRSQFLHQIAVTTARDRSAAERAAFTLDYVASMAVYVAKRVEHGTDAGEPAIGELFRLTDGLVTFYVGEQSVSARNLFTAQQVQSCDTAIYMLNKFGEGRTANSLYPAHFDQGYASESASLVR